MITPLEPSVHGFFNITDLLILVYFNFLLDVRMGFGIPIRDTREILLGFICKLGPLLWYERYMFFCVFPWRVYHSDGNRRSFCFRTLVKTEFISFSITCTRTVLRRWDDRYSRQNIITPRLSFSLSP